MSNQNYRKYDENNVEVVPQPASTPGSIDPGAGWTTQPYLDFNGDYVARDENGAPRVVGTYQRHDENNNPITPDTYQRHDENNQPV